MRGHTVGYFSSYDRGLECLLGLWPEIHKAVPDATLTIAYGWDTFDKMMKGNGEMGAWKWRMIRKMHDLKDQGVKELGRLSHTDLAKLMKQTKVWAYPTEFTEINCITALKAQEAGCIPVTTLCYALKETVVDTRFSEEVTDIYTNKEAQQRFIEHTTDALSAVELAKPVPNVAWEDVAKVWNDTLTRR